MADTYDVALEARRLRLPRAGVPRRHPERALLWCGCTAVRSCSARSTCPKPIRSDAGSARSARRSCRSSTRSRPWTGSRRSRPPDRTLSAPSPEQMRAEIEAAGPRSRFPVASLQTVAAFDWAVENAEQLGALPTRIALGGASAGGNLSTGATMRLRDRGTSVPSLLALVYPSLHDGIFRPTPS